MKKRKDINDFIGKHSGYRFTNGVYHIAPMYIENFERLMDRRVGVDQFLLSVTRHAAGINEEIAEEQRRIWNRIYDDLSLDRNKNWEYHQDGTIHEVVKPSEVKK